MTISVGITVEKSPYPVSSELTQLISSANGGPAHAARCFLQWTGRTNPSRGVFVWDEADANVKAFTDAKLPFYISSYCAPAWASGGVGWYEGYSTPCSHANQPWTGAIHEAQGDPSGQCTFVNPITFGVPGKRCMQHGRPNECDNAPDIDSTAVKDWFFALASRFGLNPYLLGIAPWNEPDISTYYWGRESDKDRGDDIYYARFGRLCHQVIAPAVEGVRDAQPGIKIIGPECAYARTLGDFLRFERESGTHLFDVLSFHYKTVVQYETEVIPVLGADRRERWISESNIPMPTDTSPTERAVEFIKSFDKFPEIARVFFHPLDLLFAPGSLKDGPPEPRDASKGYEPSPLFHELVAYGKAAGGRRRGVGK